MKKTIYLLSVAAVLLASCSNDEVVDLNQDEIKFAAVAESASRATINTTANLTEFKTYAFVEENGTQTYIDGIIASKNGTSFELADKFFWPENPVDFQFVAPTTYSIENKQIKNYVCDENTNQDDLIYATAYGETKPVGGVLGVNFRHALSQIVFKVKSLKEYGLNVTVDEIRIVNVRKGGTLTMPTLDTTTPNYSSSDSNADTELDASWGVWSHDVSIVSETQTNTYKLDVDMNANANVDGLTNDVTVTDASNYLVMPQKFTKAVIGDWKGTYFLLKVLYTKNGVTIEDGWVAVPAVAEAYTAVGTETYDNQWKQGKKYIYTFIIGEGGGIDVPKDPSDPDEPDVPGVDPVLVPITLAVTVDEYQTQEIPGIDMP